eukprot:Nitzschia sp. Nitz4//scaffold28_size193895//45400//46365//NITZ4_001637-RA/size193895-processed-gene-0.12-mRNA-1//1//CDS//3329545898//9248//frame0
MASVPNASCEEDKHCNTREISNQPHHGASFLEQVEHTVHAVLAAHNMDYDDDDQGTDREGPYQTNVQHLEPSQREPVLISRCLAGRIRDARKSNPSMAALEKALKTDRSLVLFPDESAQTFAEYSSSIDNKEGADDTDSSSAHPPWNIIVIDGTWQQARRIKLRYFDHVPKIKLSDQALQILGEETNGHQLRKHSIPWKKIATFEAVRLLLVDWFQKEWSDPKDPLAPWSKIRHYVAIANHAALARKKDGASW